MERDSLTDGRCRSCQRVFEASKKGMTYGKYVDTLPKVPIAPKAAEELPDKEYNQCRYCGAKINPWAKVCQGYECRIKMRNDAYERQKARKANALEPIRCCVCGRKFKPKRKNNKYCSEACTRAAKRKRERERRATARIII